MVRKVSVMFVCVLLIACLASTAHANTYEISGSVPTNILQYARDIISNAGFNDNYVLFSTEVEGVDVYILIVGEVYYDYNTGNFTFGKAKEYDFYSLGYGNQWYYKPSYEYLDIEIETLSNPNSYLVYSNLADFPELLSTGEKYEILQTFTLCAVVLFGLCVRIFGKR